MTDKDLQRFIDQEINDRNNRPIPDFEGYSPNEMNQILYIPLAEESVLEISKLEKPDYEKIPMLRLIHYLADIIRDKGEMKLTQKGFLPVKVVEELENQEFLRKKSSRVLKSQLKESDSVTASLARFMFTLAGLSKKRNNKLSLTKAGEKLLANDERLLETIMHVYCNKYNWAYFDYYGERIGQFGFGFSLVLLSKYGNERRPDTFYTDKYIKAFPLIVKESIPRPYSDPLKDCKSAYSWRTFDQFLNFFGLVKVEQEKWDSEKFIQKTELFDKLIKVRPPGITA